MTAVRTVLGDLPPERLGVCDAHDHLFLSSPRLAGQELRAPHAARAELAAFRALGGGSVAQWTPYGLGRRAADLPRLSRESGVQVVAATGLHQDAQLGSGALDVLDLLCGELEVPPHRVILGHLNRSPDGSMHRQAARSVNGGPGMPYLLRRLRPRLELAVGEELVTRILTENPGRAFGADWKRTGKSREVT
ncbi:MULTISPECIES: hypothetical protein [Streptomyces]|uniref:Phosphotriesterase n=2 Tax=Streptomyces TaxID=1883 RepID=A0ABV9II92_9ACTN